MRERTISVKLRAEYQGYKTAMADIRNEAKKTAAEFDASGNKITTTTGRIIRSAELNRDAWERTGRTFTLWGLSTAAALGLAARAAIQWETDWTGVLKTVEGTNDELYALEQGLRALALVKPANQSQIAAVAEAAGQLGVATKDIVSFTSVMIDLGETTNLTADEAATALAQLMNVMQTAPKDVDNLGAAVVALGNNGASTERDIVYMAQRIAGAGKIIGLTEGEVLGLANALASVGIEVEAGGSAISNIMIDISKAVADGSDDLTKWAELAGVSGEEFAQAWKNDPATALADLIEGLGDLNEAGGDVFGTLTDLGQSDVRVTRALLTMSNSGDLLRRSLELGNTAWADNTALVAEAEKRYDTTAAKAAIARNSLNELAITTGETLLPVLGELAESAASLAQGMAALPQPVQDTFVSIAGIASVALLAAGGFITWVPRIVEARKALETVRATSNLTAPSLKQFAKGGLLITGVLAGFAALAAAVEALPSQNRKAALSTAETTRALLDMQDAAGQLQGVFDFGDDVFGITGQVNSLADAANRITNPSLIDRFQDLGGSVRGLLSGGEGATSRTRSIEQINTIGQALATLVQSGDAPRAEEQFKLLAAEWERGGGTLEELRELMPDYTDALADMENQSRLAEDSSTGLASAVDQVATSTGLTVEELERWREATGNAFASFIDLSAAYQGVIDKNMEMAVSTADATKSSTDSWDDYYDGVSVSAADYIAMLQEQVTAQENWANNLVTLAERSMAVLPENMRATATAMIDELTVLGPAGAAQVELLASLTDQELQQVVELYSRRGAEAAAGINSELEGILHPYIPVEVNTTNAYADIEKLIKDTQSKTIYMGVRALGTFEGTKYGDGLGVRRAGGGEVWGPGSATSDSIDAKLSNGEFVHRTAAHQFWGSDVMHAMNRNDVGGFWAALGRRGFADGGSAGDLAYLGSPITTSPSVSVNLAGALAGATIMARFGDTEIRGVIEDVVDAAANRQSGARMSATRGR